MDFLPAEQGEKFKANLYDHGVGLAVADFDDDGLDDVFFGNQLGPCALFRNAGGGKFVETTKDAGGLAAALDGRICVAAAAADVDGDGDADLFVTTTRGGNVLLLNEGGGRFREATKEAGLTLVAESETPCFFDIDGDADLDLLVTNTARWTLDTFDETARYFPGKPDFLDLVDSAKEWNVLYRNDGKGQFTDVTEAAGMRGKGWGGDVAVFDMDADGDLDVAVGNMFGSSTLYANDGKGAFTDVTPTALGRTSWGATGLRAFDYDGDARLDLFITDMHSDMWMDWKLHESFVEEKRKYPSYMARAIELRLATPALEEAYVQRVGMRREELLFGNTLFRNLGGGKFEETSDRAGVETFWPWGIAEGDFDADGHVDAFIATGMGSPFFYWRSPLLRNRGDGTFEDVCREAGIEPPPGGPLADDMIGTGKRVRSSRAAATFDYDGDGRLDIAVNNFNERAYLFRNVSPSRHWLGLRLRGTRSGRDAIGALVRVTAGGRTQIRQVQAAGGYLSQSSNALHFGLGDAAAIERVEIRWPSGTTQTLERPAIDALTRVTEPAK